MLGGLLLLLVVIAVIAAARAALILADEWRWPVSLSAAALVLATVPAALCRVTDDLVVATVITGLACAIAAVPLWRRARRRAHPGDLPLPARWAVVVALLGAVMAIWAAFGGQIWDEHSCHFGVVGVLSRGLSPPEFPLFPGEPFRYHYGYDVLAAQVRAFTGLPMAACLDVVTSLIYLLLLAVAASAGATLAGRSGATLAIILVPLGSGALQYFLFTDFGDIQWNLAAFPKAWLHSTPPPVISNYFQHPQGTGMPLALSVLLLFDGTEARGFRLRRALVGALLTGLLSLTHIVFFAVLGLALGVSILARGASHPETNARKGAALELVMLACAPVIGYLLGGFFEPGGRTESMLVFGRGLWSEPLGQRALHLLVLFGVPLVAAPAYFLRARERPALLRVSLLTALVVGFIVPNVASYERSWDIVKFFGIAAFCANVLLADALTRVDPRRSGAHATCLAVILVLSTSTAWIWLARCSVLDGRVGIHRWQFPPTSKIAEEVARQLRPLSGPHDRVLSTNVDMSQVGFLSPGFDWRTLGAGFILDRQRVDRLRLHHNRARTHLRTEDLDALDVRFAIFSPGDLESLSAEGRANLKDRARFEHLFDAGAPDGVRFVYRVLR